MHKAIRVLDAVNEAAGRVAGALALALVALMFALVVLRDAFGWGSIAAQEAVLWLHGALFLLSLGYALRHNAHVRVDVLSQRWSPRRRAQVEIAGLLLFLLPLCVFMFWMSFDYVAASWSQREGSNSGGLPGWFLVKTLIPLSATLLFLQALAQGMRALAVLRGEQPPP